MPGLTLPNYGHNQGYNPLAFFAGLTGGTGGNVNSTVSGYGYSGDPGISNRNVLDPSNFGGVSTADSANNMTQITPQMMSDMMTGLFGQPGGGGAPTFNGFTPQSAGAFTGSGSYQGYTAAPYSGSSVSAPGAWGGSSISAPGGWSPRDIDVQTTATQNAINAQLPWIAEQRDLGFAEAGSRAGQSGFAMSTPYMESLGGVARKAASDTQAMAEQFLFQAEESARQRELQAEMQQLELEKQAWQQQGNWDMAAQVQNAQNSLQAWQSQSQMDLAAQMSNQQTGLASYQTQQGINSQNAFNQNQFNQNNAQMQNDWNMNNAAQMNQYGFANTEMMNNLAMQAWQQGINNEQDWNNFIMNGMSQLGFGSQF